MRTIQEVFWHFNFWRVTFRVTNWPAPENRRENKPLARLFESSPGHHSGSGLQLDTQLVRVERGQELSEVLK